MSAIPHAPPAADAIVSRHGFFSRYLREISVANHDLNCSQGYVDRPSVDCLGVRDASKSRAVHPPPRRGIKSGGRVYLHSRNKDFSAKCPAVVEALATMPDETGIDGELVAIIRNTGLSHREPDEVAADQ